MMAAICKELSSIVQLCHFTSLTSAGLKNQTREAEWHRNKYVALFVCLFFRQRRRELCFFRPGQQDVESALVAKYEITLDECLAWTKAKS